MRGILYGIGVGPGDPELMTLKAVRILKEADIIAAPGSSVEETVAYRIALGAVPEIADKIKLPVSMPMVMDKEETANAHKEGAVVMEKLLDEGKNIAFITLGDPCIYSTLAYVEQIVKADGYETVYISGVPSFCAAAARLGITLTKWQEPLHIIPAVHSQDEKLIGEGNYVLMKSGSAMTRVREILRESGKDVRMAENCTMENEKLYYSVDEIPDKAGYFSLIIARDSE